MAEISQINVPIFVEGATQNVTLDIKDATAREMIQSLGDSVYWMGVTTTELTDGATTSPISVGGEDKTPKAGGMAQYSGEEFVWSGSAWQSIGKNNYGSLAFKSSASGDFTPQGSITGTAVAADNATSVSVNSITNVGSLPTFSVTGEVLTFNAGTLPTKGEDTSVISSVGSLTVTQGTFSGTQGSVTVS